MFVHNYIHRELVKYKKSLLSFVIILFPVIAGVICSSALSKIYVDNNFEGIWESVLIGNKIQSIWTLISISLISIVASLIVSIDKDNKTFKVIFSSTMSRRTYYIEKLFTLSIFVFVVVFLYNLTVVITGKVIFVKDTMPYALIVKIIAKEYLTIMSIASIQLFLGFYLKNIIESIAIGILGSIVGLGFMSQMPKVAFINPYSYPYSVLSKNVDNVNGNIIILFSILYFLVISILGVRKMKKVDVNEVE